MKPYIVLTAAICLMYSNIMYIDVLHKYFKELNIRGRCLLEINYDCDQLHLSTDFCPYLRKILIMRIQTYLNIDKYYNAVFCAERFFIKFPMAPEISQVHYIKGLSHLRQLYDVAHDFNSILLSFEEMHIILEKYTHSKYRAWAQKICVYLRNLLANKEMEIGRYYMRTKSPISAIMHFKHIIIHYQDSVLYPEALYRVIRSYLAVGAHDTAFFYFTKLRQYFKYTIWYKKIGFYF